jgi:hypothetical protein
MKCVKDLHRRKEKRFIQNRLFLLFLLLLISFSAVAQREEETSNDEISVLLDVQNVGSTEIPAIIHGRTIFIPPAIIFTFLKIRNSASPGLDSVLGDFINPEAWFVIDNANKRILYQGKSFELHAEDAIKTETALYLRSDLLGSIFGLNCDFNFRGLTVRLTPQMELPAVREMRQEQLRKNINRLKGQVLVDTVIRQSYPLFRFGMTDWSVISNQQLDGPKQTMASLNLGGVLLGGQANVALNYNSEREFKERDQYYQWRFVNNNLKAIRQIAAGKIQPFATSSIYSPIVGLQVTNSPTTFRRSFGTYTLSNFTEPNWIVELFVNNVLVDYVKADATGFYTFQVPLVYGSSELRLRFYGPFGEERTRSENIYIPFNFLPKGNFEYSLSAGAVEDNQFSQFGRGQVNYGLTGRLTIGGGVEYLSSVINAPVMPFITTSFRVGQGFLFSGDYMDGVRLKTLASYRFRSNLLFEANYIKYKEGQKAINYNYLEERKFTISGPLRGRRFSMFTRLSFDQIILPTTEYTTAEWLISGSIKKVNTHTTTYAVFAKEKPYVYTNVSLGFRLPKGILVTPECQYEWNNNLFISAKTKIEKHLLPRGYLSVYHEKNFKSDFQIIGIDFRYDLSFAQVGTSVRNVNDKYHFLQTARGSFKFDPAERHVKATNVPSVGRGNIVLIPFLDMNNNGKKDKGEPKVQGLRMQANGGGRIEVSRKDTVIRIFDLEPYSNYIVELDGNNFESISWQIRKMTMSIAVDPNQFKHVYIPVAVLGEVSGMVYIEKNGVQKGQGQIIVSFYKDDTTFFSKTLTEPDGYFSFLGLPSGQYTVRVDSGQLSRLHMVSAPPKVSVTVNNEREGVVIEHIDFILRRKEE